MSPLSQKQVTVIVTGSIAAYKSCEVIRNLIRRGAQVHVIMTKEACEFITPLTLATLSKHPVRVNAFDPDIPHVQSAQKSNLIVVVPATANILAKMAYGIADDLASSTLLARTSPTAVVPAMNCAMWEAEATKRNVKTLHEDGVVFIGPCMGDLACGREGIGRMIDPTSVVEACERMLTPSTLKGKKVLVTAGPTVEAIDPIRAITNRSSGKQGYAIAKAAYEAAAKVILISGPTALKAPYGVTLKSIRTAQEMLEAVNREITDTDIFISVAAVADWGVKDVSDRKIKKDRGQIPAIELVENPDILALTAKAHPEVYCVGFAAETENAVENAQKKLVRKNARLVVANLAQNTLGSDTNQVYFVDREKTIKIDATDKLDIARELIARIANEV